MTSFEKSTNILLFVALPEEHDVLLEQLPAVGSVSSDRYVISEHDLGIDRYRLVSVLAAEMGNDNAYEAVSETIEKCCPDLVICVGIAGSLSSDLKIGDVSVSQEIIDVSQNLKIVDKAGKKSGSIELSPKALPIDERLTAGCRFVRSHPTLKPRYGSWQDDAAVRRSLLSAEFDAAGLRDELDVEPLVEVGPMVSGPIVASAEFKKTLRSIDRKVSAIETESAGMYRACQKRNIPCVSIRGISDHADPAKNALERTSKLGMRRLAAENAISYLRLQLQNPAFLRAATYHASLRMHGKGPLAPNAGPERILAQVQEELDEYLCRMSPEYKHRPNGATLPLPRVSRLFSEQEIVEEDARAPVSIFQAIERDRRIYLKIPRSYPNQTLAWSVGQSLLRGEIDGRQILPLVISGGEIMPPKRGLRKIACVDPMDPEVVRDFFPVIIISEPEFTSKGRTDFLKDEIKDVPDAVVILISRAEGPLERIESVKTEASLAEYESATVPFTEIADYLEKAFEMGPAEAESVATRLDDTFSKFRMQAHPSYFVGLQETTLSAFIDANQRAELIQLAVSGLLTFAVLFDQSQVKVSRTFREEFLGELAYRMKCEAQTFNEQDVSVLAKSLADERALELNSKEFVRAYFAVGLLTEFAGQVSFSIPYVEAYLLAERLKSDGDAALVYFDPSLKNFDHYSFDLYAEQGASKEVVAQVIAFSDKVLAACGDEENVFLARKVNPRALSSSASLVELATEMSEVVRRISGPSDSDDTRQVKQRLLDARRRVGGRVQDADSQDRSELSPERRVEFERLDGLSRALTLLATLLGSGAERLSSSQKIALGSKMLTVFERFLHYWTMNRLSQDFGAIRDELLSEDALNELMDELGAYETDREEVARALELFLDDKELKSLGGPLAVLLSRLSHYSGVRSLKPIIGNLKTNNEIESVARDVLLMDVEHRAGRSALKNSLQGYKGSTLLRLIVANHLMLRVFWHHWQRNSRDAFVEVAHYALKPMKLTFTPNHQAKSLAGPRGSPADE